MQINSSHKSPNFSGRNNTVKDTIIIHHTGGNDGAKTVKWFCMKGSSGSAHYVIDRDGTVYQLVPDNKSAWHAGKSWLPDAEIKSGSVNNRSIGIELVNKGDGQTIFPPEQMESLRELVIDLKSKYPIAYVLGHKEVAPGRKDDPADNFDWSFVR